MAGCFYGSRIFSIIDIVLVTRRIVTVYDNTDMKMLVWEPISKRGLEITFVYQIC